MKKLNVCKFVAKFLKYRILIKDILAFLGLDYRDASLIILCLIVIGISNPKIRWFYHIKIGIKSKKTTYLKWMYGHSGNDFRFATLSNSYLTTTEIILQSLKSIG